MNIAPRTLHPKVKQLVRVHSIYAMLSKQADPQIPEAKLVVAVICQAIDDCYRAGHVFKCRAWNFMNDERLELWAGAVGLDAGFIRHVAIKTGYMTPERPNRPPAKSKKKGVKGA